MKTKLKPEAYDVNEYGGQTFLRDVRPRYSPGFQARIDDMIAAGRDRRIAPAERSTGDGKKTNRKKSPKGGGHRAGKAGARRKNN